MDLKKHWGLRTKRAVRRAVQPVLSQLKVETLERRLMLASNPMANDPLPRRTVYVPADTTNTPDLQVVSLGVYPAAPTSGRTLNINWEDENTGGGFVSSYHDYVTVVNQTTGDRLLNTYINGSVSYYTKEYPNSTSVLLPENSSAVGQLLITVKINAEFEVTESNYNNDTSTFTVNSTYEPLPDLQVSNLNLKPSSVAIGTPFTLSWNDYNAGLGSAANYNDSVQIVNTATNQIAYSNEINNFTTTIAAGGSLPQSQSIPTDNFAAGTYLVTVTTNDGDLIQETTTTNDTATTQLLVTVPPAPDLQVTGLSVSPNPLQTGQQVTINWKDANTGNATATGNWTDQLTVVNTSTNQTLFSDFLPFTAGSLAAGSTAAESDQFTLPADSTGVGNLQVQVTTDCTNVVKESHSAGTGETNNTATTSVTSTLTPRADLVASNVAGPTSAYAGTSVIVSWTDSNSGSVTATGPWTDDIELVTPQSTLQLGTLVYSGSLTPGQSVNLSTAVSLPSTLTGNCHFAVNTGSNSVPEYNTTNNYAVAANPILITTQPLPNLVVSSVTAPPSAIAGQQTQVQWTVSNQGTGDTSSQFWYDTVYLSTQPTLDTSSGAVVINLGYVRNASYLRAGDSYASSLAVTLPQNVQGTYYFIVQTDSGNEVRESNENDNVLAASATTVQLAPSPDLQVSSVIAGATQTFSGSTLPVSWTVTNSGQGPTAANMWNDGIYLSTSPTFDNSAILVDTVAHYGALAANTSYNASDTITVPNGISGKYYVYVETDIADQVFEYGFTPNKVNRATNPVTVNLTPPPDLTASGVSTSTSTLISGHTVTITAVNAVNAGAGDVPGLSSWVDSYYLVPSGSSFNPKTAIYLGNVNQDGYIAAGDPFTASGTFTIPYNIDGSYTPYIVLNSSQSLFETNYSNDAISGSSVAVITQNPQLAVTSVNAPATVTAGVPFNISWTVTNNGPGDTVAGTWFDAVNLATNGSLPVLVDQKAHIGDLTAGQSYTATDTVTLPASYAGNYQLSIQADVGGSVVESAVSPSSASQPINVIANAPDLDVTQVTAPTTANIGVPFNISWTVANIGTQSTNGGLLQDVVYLSTSPTLPADPDTNAFLVGYFDYNHDLAPGQQYTLTKSITLPGNAPQGPLYAIVQVNTNDQNEEAPTELANDTLAASNATTISANPLAPDLKTTAVTAPSQVTAGQKMKLSWTVTNLGGSTTPTADWFDSIYFSRDQLLDANDTHVQVAEHGGVLASGQTYTTNDTIQVPDGYTGQFYVIIVADDGSIIYNDVNPSDKIGVSNTVASSLAPPTDLVAGSITIPSTAVLGENVTVSYTVTNNGPYDVDGSFTDALYLSSDGTFNVNDPLLGTVTHNGDTDPVLANGGSYTATLTAPLPAVSPGNYKVIVRTDIYGQLPESDQSNNNIGASLDAFSINVPVLQLGSSATGSLAQGQGVFYQVNVPANDDLQIALTTDNAGASNELFVRYGQVPTRTQFDYGYADPLQPDQTINIPNTQGGTYYIYAYGDSVNGAQNFTLSAKEVSFSVSDSNYGLGGTAGDRTLAINGAKFDSSTVANLEDNGQIAATAIAYTRSSSTQLYATFDLAEVTPGLYDVVLNNSTGGVATVPGGLQVVAGGGPNLQISNTLPTAISRPNHDPSDVDTYSVGWYNAGDDDAEAPFIQISSTTSIGLTASDAITQGAYTVTTTSVGNDTFDDYTGSQLGFYGIAASGPAGLILPSASGSRIIYQAVDADPATIETSVYSLGTDTGGTDKPTDPYPWQDLQEKVKPPDLTDTQFAPLFAEYIAQVGPTWADFLAECSRNATLLPADGSSGDPTNVYDLIRLGLNRFVDNSGSAIVGSIIADDLSVPLGDQTVQATDGSTGNSVSATTLNDGSYLIPDVTPGTYTLDVPNTQVATVATVTVGTTPVSAATLVVGRGDTITGVATNATTGLAVVGATISASDSNGRGYETTSSSNGTYTLTGLPNGSLTLNATAANEATINESAVAIGSGNNTVDLPFQPEAPLSGTLAFDASSVTPAPTVTATPVGGGPVYTATLGGNEFTFVGLASGTYDVTVLTPGYATQAITNVAVSASAPVDLGTISIPVGASVTGTVTSQETGLDLSTVTIQAVQGATVIATAEVEEDGGYEFDGLAAGTYTLKIVSSSGDAAPTSITVKSGNNVTKENLTVFAAATVSGKVTNSLNASPIAGLAVTARSDTGHTYSAVTAADGSYSFADVKSGNLTISLPIASASSTTTLAVDTTMSSTYSAATLSIPVAAIIHGTLTTSSGAAISDGGVDLVRSGATIATAYTNSNGVYTLFITTPGTFDLKPSAVDATFNPVTGVLVANGQSITEDFSAGTASIQATITPLSGANPNGDIVQLSQTVGGQSILVSTTTVNSAPATSATVTFANLVAGTYTVSVDGTDDSSGSSAATIVGTGATQSTTVQLKAGSEVTGEITDGSANPIANAFIIFVPANTSLTNATDTTDPDGTFDVKNLMPGNYSVAVVANGYETVIMNNFTVAAGVSQAGSIALAAAVDSFTGRVVDANGNPVLGAAVSVTDPNGIPIGSTTTAADGSYTVGALAESGLTVSIDAAGALPVTLSNQSASGLTPLPDTQVAPLAAGTAAVSAVSSNNVAVKQATDLKPLAASSESSLFSDIQYVLGDIQRAPNDQQDSDLVPLSSKCSSCTALHQQALNAIYTENLAYEVYQGGHNARNAAALVDQIQIISGLDQVVGAIASILDGYAAAKESIAAATSSASALGAVADTASFGQRFTGLLEQGTDTLNTITSAFGDGIDTSYLGDPGDGSALAQAVQADADKTLQGINDTASFESLIESGYDTLNNFAGKATPGGAIAFKTAALGLKSVLFVTNGIDSIAKNLVASDDQLSSTIREEESLKRIYRRDADIAKNLVDRSNACAKADTSDDCGGPNRKKGGPFGFPPGPSTPSNSPVPTRKVSTHDPNDITGPTGAGAEHFVAASQPLGYTVQFENDPTLATAPVQHVRITLNIDPSLDVRTFRLGNIGFGDVAVTVPGNRSYYQTTLDETATLGVDVVITAGIDVTTGQAFWDFQAIDPTTGQPPTDPTIGFLPPNTGGTSGEGFVTYTVRPVAAVTSGTAVSAQARIFFDNNDPLDTPIATNTLDAIAPTSTVTALPSTESSPTFNVIWSGADDANGSGVASYSVYVSDNGGAYTAWLPNTVATTAMFTGQAGYTYSFYTVAADNAGNVQATPTAAQATTTVSGTAAPLDVAAFTVNDGSVQRSMVRTLTVTFTSPVTLDGGAITLSFVSGSTSTPVTFTDSTSDGGLTYILTPTSNVTHGSLTDGNYSVAINPSGVHSASNPATTLSGATRTYSFFRLFGDINGDGTVNLLDYKQFQAAFQKSTGQTGFNANFDSDGNGTIDLVDYKAFTANYLRTLSN